MNRRNEFSPWTVCLSFVGAVVGAGFISGQELVQFFIRFGTMGLLGWGGLVLFMLVAGSLGLEMLSKQRYESFDKYINSVYGSTMAPMISLVFNGYLIGGLLIMVSGASSLLSEVSTLVPQISVGVVVVAIFLTIIGQAKRMLSVNRWLVPILILATIVVSISLISSGTQGWKEQVFEIKNPSPLMPHWSLGLLLYIGYNTLGAIVGFINIAKETSPEKAKLGGLLGAILVGVLGTMLLMTLWITYPTWKQSDVPIVCVIKDLYPQLFWVYVPAMGVAMFTVATTYALGIAKYLQDKTGVNYLVICTGLLASTYPLSLLGFSKLLGIVYPIFGIAAALIMPLALIKTLGSVMAKNRQARKGETNV